jgi:ABC-2 type transport system ATP-binding protein
MIMLNFIDVTKTFKSDLFTQNFTALKNVSFDIPSGSMVGFLGANGAGKTTSLKVIMDFIRPDTGTVQFSKELGNNKTEVFKNIGFLPERPYFYANLKGIDFLRFMGQLSEVPSQLIEANIKKWAPRFRIDHALSREIRTYSKGMLQRIGFLSTILHDPKFIILDEPLSGLDPIGRKELKDVIVEVHRAGKTVFFSSHIVPDIEEICDRVIFLKDGNLAFNGTVDSLLNTAKASDYDVKFKSDKVLSFKTKTINQEKYPGNLQVVRVSEINRQTLLQELLTANVDVVGVEVIKPSLEEIFYHQK